MNSSVRAPCAAVWWGRAWTFVFPASSLTAIWRISRPCWRKRRCRKRPQAQALKIFNRLAEVEGKLHNVPPGEVHFHEVGAVDAVIDIVGACVGLELLEISDLVCSPLNVGSGRVDAAHGSLPVPAPATAELLKDIPVYSSGVEGELVTPTGAALVATLASGFGPLPPMKIAKIGYGAGEKDFPDHPNIARLFVGEQVEAVAGQAGPARRRDRFRDRSQRR